MKHFTRNVIRGLAVCAVLVAAVCLAPNAYAGIVGSDHDFSVFGWSGGEICVVCHTPHEADTTVTAAPLWNHELSAKVYNLYSSTTLDAVDLGQPNGVSKLCLGCHDGTVAIDSFGGATGGIFMGGDHAVGAGPADLTDDHPISFTYDAALATADGGLFDPVTTPSGLGTTINNDMLFSSKLECASCHDVHDAAGFPELLRINNGGSALCLTCHDL